MQQQPPHRRRRRPEEERDPERLPPPPRRRAARQRICGPLARLWEGPLSSEAWPFTQCDRPQSLRLSRQRRLESRLRPPKSHPPLVPPHQHRLPRRSSRSMHQGLKRPRRHHLLQQANHQLKPPPPPPQALTASLRSKSHPRCGVDRRPMPRRSLLPPTTPKMGTALASPCGRIWCLRRHRRLRLPNHHPSKNLMLQ